MATPAALDRPSAPPPAARTLWLAGAAGIAGAGALAAVLAATAPAGTTGVETAVYAVGLGGAYAFLAWAARFPARATPLGSAPPGRLLATWASAAAVTAALWVILGLGLARGLGWMLADPAIPGRFRERAALLLWLGLLGYVLAAALHYLGHAALETRQARLRETEARAWATEAELRALRQQASPHFLFNCLNTISSLVGRDPAAARVACLDLADLLRQTLRLGSRESLIPLAAELQLVDRYLALEALRLGTRLRVERRLDAAVEGLGVPPLLLLPLVENAVTHGIGPRAQGGEIRLAARPVEGGQAVEIEIENPLDPARAGRGAAGSGLAGVRRRLTALYGPNQGAVIDAEPLDGRFRVRIRLPSAAPSPADGEGQARGPEAR